MDLSIIFSWKYLPTRLRLRSLGMHTYNGHRGSNLALELGKTKSQGANVRQCTGSRASALEYASCPSRFQAMSSELVDSSPPISGRIPLQSRKRMADLNFSGCRAANVVDRPTGLSACSTAVPFNQHRLHVCSTLSEQLLMPFEHNSGPNHATNWVGNISEALRALLT